MSDALTPGQTIGILGGGQLGRMLAMAAARLGFRVHVYDPAANPPAGEVAARTTTASYDDAEATLRVHLHHLRRKIEPDPRRPRYVRTERGIGYRFQTHPASVSVSNGVH